MATDAGTGKSIAPPPAGAEWICDGRWVLTLPCPRVPEVNSLSSHVGPRGDTLQTDAGTAEGDKVPEPRGSICFIGHT